LIISVVFFKPRVIVGTRKMVKMEDSKVAQSTTPVRQPRQQYHYLYGSTDSTSSTERGVAGAASPTGTATDQDSLLGEALVNTDNENEEASHDGEKDFEQLLMTNGNGVHPLLAKKKQKNEGTKSWIERLKCRKLRQKHPTLYFAIIVGCVAVSFSLFCISLPKEWVVSNLPTTADLTFVMPFARVDRRAGDDPDPIEEIIRKDLFDPRFFYHGPDPSREFIFPFPTGKLEGVLLTLYS
jgi:hypothetical protein